MKVAVIGAGARLGVPTPLNAMLWSLVKLLEARAVAPQGLSGATAQSG